MNAAARFLLRLAAVLGLSACAADEPTPAEHRSGIPSPDRVDVPAEHPNPTGDRCEVPGGWADTISFDVCALDGIDFDSCSKRRFDP